MASPRFVDAILNGAPLDGQSPVLTDEDGALDAYSSVVTRVAELLIPSVASLRVRRRLPGGRAEGAGSAVVITPDGFLLTSAHVVAGSTGGSASFVDGREAKFEIVGTDPLSDMAVVRVGTGDLTPASLGDADRLRVVGVSTAVAGVGLGLAVPINATTRKIIASLMTEGRFRRAYLGIAGGPRPLPPRMAREVGRKDGVEIVEVVPGSPAALAGLRPEDLILDVDGVGMESARDLQRLMAAERIGRPVPVRVFRDGSIVELVATPRELQG